MNWWLQYYFSSSSLDSIYLVSKARAAQEGDCIFLPLFLVFPYQSEKVVVTPTREIEIEGKAAGRVLKQKKCSTAWPQTQKSMPPTSLHCPASSAKQIPCPAARDSSLVTWLFSPFHQPRSSEGFTRGERLHKVMETRQRNREAIASSQLQRRGGCNEAWSVTRKNHRPVFAFPFPFFIVLPYLFFLLLIIRKKKRQWEGRRGGWGGGRHAHRGIQGGEREHISIAREKND